MGRSRREIHATAEATLTPPDNLADGQLITRVIKAAGNNLYDVQLPSGQALLVELPSRFRSIIWIRRGGYVLVDTTAFSERSNKLDGEIINVVREEKVWRKQNYWPAEFSKSSYPEDDDESTTAGQLPPSDSEDE